MTVKISYDKQNAEAYLGAAIAAYTEALEIALNFVEEKG